MQIMGSAMFGVGSFTELIMSRLVFLMLRCIALCVTFPIEHFTSHEDPVEPDGTAREMSYIHMGVCKRSRGKSRVP